MTLRVKVLGVLFSVVVGTVFVLIPALAQDKAQKKQVLFTNVNIFDGKSDKLLTNRRVLVEGNLIKMIGDNTLKANKGETVINGGGRTLMPCLIDSHMHVNMYVPGTTPDLENTTWERIGASSVGLGNDGHGVHYRA